MKISTREDIAAPIETVFAEVANLGRMERGAMMRGARIQRLDDLSEPGAGVRWKASFDMRGKARVATAEVIEWTQPDGYRMDFASAGVEGSVEVELIALAPQRTRLRIAADFRPATLTGRLLIQSFRLGKAALTERLSTRVAEFARQIETCRKTA